ncbi:hypothetical protein ACFQU7_14855 [Pseudoroseomonas wenyumeiae]
MGLGLSICHGIIRSFGGEITGENVEGGAAFSIRLPIAEAAGTAEAALPAQSISRKASHHECRAADQHPASSRHRGAGLCHRRPARMGGRAFLRCRPLRLPHPHRL